MLLRCINFTNDVLTKYVVIGMPLIPKSDEENEKYTTALVNLRGDKVVTHYCYELSGESIKCAELLRESAE